jgi:hypothetical protein
MNKVFAVAVRTNFGIHFESMDISLDRAGDRIMCGNFMRDL